MGFRTLQIRFAHLPTFIGQNSLISLIFLSQLNRNKSGQVGFFQIFQTEFAQIALFCPKNAQKPPFSENGSEFPSPLSSTKSGQKPTFYGQKMKSQSIFRPYTSPKITQFSKSPTFHFQKWAQNHIKIARISST